MEKLKIRYEESSCYSTNCKGLKLTLKNSSIERNPKYGTDDYYINLAEIELELIKYKENLINYLLKLLACKFSCKEDREIVVKWTEDDINFLLEGCNNKVNLRYRIKNGNLLIVELLRILDKLYENYFLVNGEEIKQIF
jgi:hypothetical protein